MAGQPQGGSPLDKLSKDVSQYRQRQMAGKRTASQPVIAREERSPTHAGPGWTELDRTLSSQVLVGLLMAVYALLMLAATLSVFVLLPSGSIVLWPVMAIGVIVAMIAHHKARPPLLWFMYGSVVPMGPLAHAALMNKAGGLAALGQMQGLLGGAAQPATSSLDLLLCVCVVGAIPLVHAILMPQGREVSTGSLPPQQGHCEQPRSISSHQ